MTPLLPPGPNDPMPSSWSAFANLDRTTTAPPRLESRVLDDARALVRNRASATARPAGQLRDPISRAPRFQHPRLRRLPLLNQRHLWLHPRHLRFAALAAGVLLAIAATAGLLVLVEWPGRAPGEERAALPNTPAAPPVEAAPAPAAEAASLPVAPNAVTHEERIASREETRPTPRRAPSTTADAGDTRLVVRVRMSPDALAAYGVRLDDTARLGPTALVDVDMVIGVDGWPQDIRRIRAVMPDDRPF